MKELLNDIKKRYFKNVYLFYGEEKFLIRYYENKLKETLISPGFKMMNIDVFDGKKQEVNAVISAVGTLPYESENRLVIVKDSGMFVSGRKDDSIKMAEYITHINGSVVLLFVESEVDKRNKLYKAIEEKGRVVEFKLQREKELSTWVCNIINKKGGRISAQNAVVLLRTVAGDMERLDMETDKLVSYKGESEILKDDIELLCSKALETNIFDMISSAMNKDVGTAINIFSNMLLMKEQPTVVLNMLARQFRLILNCKLLAEKGMNSEEIAAAIGVRSFMIRDYMSQSGKFTEEKLIYACKRCFETDLGIKTGTVSGQTGVEALIVEVCV